MGRKRQQNLTGPKTPGNSIIVMNKNAGWDRDLSNLGGSQSQTLICDTRENPLPSVGSHKYV